MRTWLRLISVVLFGTALQAHALDAAVQAKVDSKIKDAKSWAANPAVVSAVKAQNGAQSADAAGMTQDKWKSLTVLDPFVRARSKNPAAEFLKTNKSEAVTEIFVSAADGSKVAFLGKPSNWSHKGKPKHDVPMNGQTWQGEVEVDESTGTQQLQIAVPVLDGGKAIGSLVVGLSVGKLGA